MEEIKFANGASGQRGIELFTKKAKTFYKVENVVWEPEELTDDLPEMAIMRLLDIVASDDGTKTEVIPGKGHLSTMISSTLFELLKGKYTDKLCSMPIKTHYMTASCDRDDECLIAWMHQVIPLEVLVRNRAYGSYLKRHRTVEEGTKFLEPICEFTEKDDARNDPFISEEQIVERKIANDLEVRHMREVAMAVNQILSAFFREINIELIDFKLVFGRLCPVGIGDPTNLRIIGELSPDVFRLLDMETGKFLDKEIFRKGLPGLEEAYATVARRMHEYQSRVNGIKRTSTYDGYGENVAKK